MYKLRLNETSITIHFFETPRILFKFRCTCWWTVMEYFSTLYICIYIYIDILYLVINFIASWSFLPFICCIFLTSWCWLLILFLPCKQCNHYNHTYVALSFFLQSAKESFLIFLTKFCINFVEIFWLVSFTRFIYMIRSRSRSPRRRSYSRGRSYSPKRSGSRGRDRDRSVSPRAKRSYSRDRRSRSVDSRERYWNVSWQL